MIRVLQRGLVCSGALRGTGIVACVFSTHAEPRTSHQTTRDEIFGVLYPEVLPAASHGAVNHDAGTSISSRANRLREAVKGNLRWRRVTRERRERYFRSAPASTLIIASCTRALVARIEVRPGWNVPPA